MTQSFSPRIGPPRIGPPRIGLELELIPVNRVDGSLHAVDDAYFQALDDRRGGAGRFKRLEGRILAARGPHGLSGLDNGFALLETAFDPLDATPGVLATLADRVARELGEISQVLADRGAALLDMARHPTAPADRAAWARLKAPRAVYDYLVHDRGWTHAAGFDSQAQNGPTISVPPERAIRALNMLLRAGPAVIALFANSPLARGRETGLLESRLGLWPAVTATSRVARDRAVVGLPEAPFRDMAHYLRWTFGRGRPMHAVPMDGPGGGAGGGYKGEDGLARIDGDPSLLDFLAGGPRAAHPIGPHGTDPSTRLEVTPRLSHLVALQWSNFLDVRLRFSLERPEEDPAAFLAALDRPGGVEAFFAERADNLYLENRLAGCCLPESLASLRENGAPGRSVLVGASAIQLGLMKNFDRAAPALEALPWPQTLVERSAAMALGLSDPSVKKRAEMVLALAEEGLAEEDRWALDFPRRVLLTGKSKADKALEVFRQKGVLGLMTSRLLVH